VANAESEVARVTAEADDSAKQLQKKKQQHSAKLLMDFANSWAGDNTTWCWRALAPTND
jgi:hypothetical protein